MSITQAMCNVYKRDVHDGVHLPSHVYKMALIKPGSAGALGAATTAYGDLGTDEIANGNGYTTGGIVLTGRTVQLLAGVGVLDFSDPVWAAATISAAGALVYNDSVAGKPAIGVLDFGGTITSTNGNFTVDLPAPGSATSIFRFA